MNFLIARFNTNGTLDPSFGFGGFNVMDFAGWRRPGVGARAAAGRQDPGGGNGLQRHPQRLRRGPLQQRWNRRPLVRCRRQEDSTSSLVGPQPLRHLGRRAGLGPDRRRRQRRRQSRAGRTHLERQRRHEFRLSGTTTRDLGGSDYLETMVMGTDNRIYAAGARIISGNGDWAPVAVAGLRRARALHPRRVPGPPPTWTSARPRAGSMPWMFEATATSSWREWPGNVARWAQFAPGSSTPDATGQVTFPGNATTGLAVRFAGLNRIVLAGSHYFQGDRNMTVSLFEAIPNTTVSVSRSPVGRPVPRSGSPRHSPIRSSPGPRSRSSCRARQSVRLAILDVSGRRGAELVNGDLARGQAPAALGRHRRLTGTRWPRASTSRRS